MEITVEEIENLIIQLPQKQLNKFRVWYEKFDSDMWDEQIKKDVVSGKLDVLADTAIIDHKAGRTKRL